ncbi:MAG: bifunctional phosphopantothenoylcysteine decarboxylase/phosphopantothenate--cysteine ligase CoaBC [Sulfobacillus sp.]|nr:bifunctional phosphopantothenoylcysteine decarboxylase/phosphopantothenate--cysteine ligase CoaBC [Sulfobacillus sp.]
MRIVLGVAGGIAAYKACELASRLTKDGHDVSVLMTRTATEFVSPLTFRALTGRAVAVTIGEEPFGPLSHVHLAHWADALVIAPATADLLARLAAGRADDMLSAVYLGFQGPRLIAPAMEPEMWAHPRTQANVAVLRQDGVRFIGPTAGRMASGHYGVGRLAEPEAIQDALVDLLTPKDLAGLRMLVTAGSTWEYFDPVRVITNPATGLMGKLLAGQAVRRGAEVAVVAGPGVTPLTERTGLVWDTVVSAEEMLTRALVRLPGMHVVVGTAAVSDFRPAKRAEQKVHKAAVGLSWPVEPNPDVIRTLAEQADPGTLMIGFAAETDNIIESAQRKRLDKKLDAVVANRVGLGVGFGTGAHEAWLVTADGVEPMPGHHKEETATALLNWVARHRPPA